MKKYESPYKGPRGYYHVKVYNTATQRRTTRSTGVRTSSEAMNVVRSWHNKPDGRWLFSAAWDLYFKDVVSKRAAGYIHSVKVKTKVLRARFGDMLLEDISPVDMSNHFVERRGLMATETVIVEMSSARTFFKWCLDHEILAANPMRLIRQPRREIKEPRILEPEELQALFAEARKPEYTQLFYVWLQVAIWSGIRIGTLLQINPRCFSLGAHPRWLIPGSMMKAGRPLKVPMAPQCAEILQAWLVESEPGEDDRVFPRAYKWIWKTFRNVTKECGLEDVTPHALRRTFITTLIRAGATEKLAARLAGIRNLRVLHNHYYATRVRDEEEIIETFDPFALSKVVVETTIAGAKASDGQVRDELSGRTCQEAFLIVDNSYNAHRKEAKKRYKREGRSAKVFQALPKTAEDS
jgi:integrase